MDLPDVAEPGAAHHHAVRPGHAGEHLGLRDTAREDREERAVAVRAGAGRPERHRQRHGPRDHDQAAGSQDPEVDLALPAR